MGIPRVYMLNVENPGRSLISTMVLYRHINIINREAIDVFFTGQLLPSKRSEVAGGGR